MYEVRWSQIEQRHALIRLASQMVLSNYDMGHKG